MTNARPHLVTLRHRETGEYKTTVPDLTDSERRNMLTEIWATGNYEPNVKFVAVAIELPSAFAINADVVNVIDARSVPQTP